MHSKEKKVKKKKVPYLPTLFFSDCNLNYTYFLFGHEWILYITNWHKTFKHLNWSSKSFKSLHMLDVDVRLRKWNFNTKPLTSIQTHLTLCHRAQRALILLRACPGRQVTVWWGEEVFRWLGYIHRPPFYVFYSIHHGRWQRIKESKEWMYYCNWIYLTLVYPCKLDESVIYRLSRDYCTFAIFTEIPVLNVNIAVPDQTAASCLNNLKPSLFILWTRYMYQTQSNC